MSVLFSNFSESSMPSKKQVVEDTQLEVETSSEEEVAPEPQKARKKRTMTPDMLAKLAIARQAALEKRQSATGTKKKERELEKKRKDIESASRAARVKELEAEIEKMQKAKQHPKKAVKKPKKIKAPLGPQFVESSSSESEYEEQVPRKTKHMPQVYAPPTQSQEDYHEKLAMHLFGRS